MPAEGDIDASAEPAARAEQVAVPAEGGDTDVVTETVEGSDDQPAAEAPAEGDDSA